jgi:RNA 2',3'-cyclic 3'-phosphodiesterase
MRCFVAVEVPEEVREAVARAREELRRAEADVKWVEPGNLHLTLKFLGELEAPALARLFEALGAAAARRPRMRLAFEGLGFFPGVLWAGCAGDLEPLAGLAEAVERAAESVGVPREGRPFTAHLTIGRVKSRRNEGRLRAAVEERRGIALGTAEVGAFALMTSTLTPSGPIYARAGMFALHA